MTTAQAQLKWHSCRRPKSIDFDDVTRGHAPEIRRSIVIAAELATESEVYTQLPVAETVNSSV